MRQLDWRAQYGQHPENAIRNFLDKLKADAQIAIRAAHGATTALELDALLDGALRNVADNSTFALSRDAILNGLFARSGFIKHRTKIPAEFIKAQFGRHFDIENGGNVVARYEDGMLVSSNATPGQPAEFEEALMLLIEASPFKDNILKEVMPPAQKTEKVDDTGEGPCMTPSGLVKGRCPKCAMTDTWIRMSDCYIVVYPSPPVSGACS